jgi:endogenous inhibitor of DNA gyrase (YacG/DUF329 family)
MTCPICHKKVDISNVERPFCSERCRIIDLGNWASEKYVVSSPLRPEDMDEADVGESEIEPRTDDR